MSSRFRRKDGSLTHEHFQLQEFIQTARMRWDGLSNDDVIAVAKSDNVFQFPTTGQIATFTRGMLNRLDALEDEGLVGLVARGSSDQAAQINIYAMMRIYSIMAAFMVEEVGQRYLTLNPLIGASDINAFMTRYCSQDDQAAAWSESTIKRVRSVLVETLVKGGYLSDRSSDELLPVFIEPALEEVMHRNGNAAWLPAFNCLEVRP